MWAVEGHSEIISLDSRPNGIQPSKIESNPEV